MTVIVNAIMPLNSSTKIMYLVNDIAQCGSFFLNTLTVCPDQGWTGQNPTGDPL